MFVVDILMPIYRVAARGEPHKSGRDVIKAAERGRRLFWNIPPRHSPAVETDGRGVESESLMS